MRWFLSILLGLVLAGVAFLAGASVANGHWTWTPWAASQVSISFYTSTTKPVFTGMRGELVLCSGGHILEAIPLRGRPPELKGKKTQTNKPNGCGIRARKVIAGSGSLTVGWRKLGKHRFVRFVATAPDWVFSPSRTLSVHLQPLGVAIPVSP